MPLLRLGLRVTDGETPETSFLSGRNMNPAVSGTCQSRVNCTAKQLSIPEGSDDTMIAYYGRLLASTRQGSIAPAGAALQVQYFEGACGEPIRKIGEPIRKISVPRSPGGRWYRLLPMRSNAMTPRRGSDPDGTRIRLGLPAMYRLGRYSVGFDAGGPVPLRAAQSGGAHSLSDRAGATAIPTRLVGGSGHGGSPAGRGHFWPGSGVMTELFIAAK